MLSLSRDEVCQTFGITPAALDALIAGGSLLCFLADGEPRIPIDQLERFFRENLLRVYRAEARATEETIVASVESRPEAVGDAPAEPEPQPVQTRPQAATPDEIRADIAETEDEDDSFDLRVAPRYIPRRQIDGIIDDVKFTIVQMSDTGLRIRHTAEILPSADSKLTFALLNPARSFVMRGRVVWTSAATTDSGERKFFISGVKITEHVDRLAKAIDILSASHDLQPDRRAAARTSDDDELPTGGASDEDIALVMKAIQHFSADPVDANRWYARGRFALSEPQVRREAPRKPRDREEVLGIWEFLDRQVDIAKIGDVLGWVRRNRGTGSTSPRDTAAH